MLSYYGSKYRDAKYYPNPVHRRVVELFAGGAGYSLFHWRSMVEISDVDPYLSDAWRFLMRSSRDPTLVSCLKAPVDAVDEVPEDARNFVGYWMHAASSNSPKRFVSARCQWTSASRDRIAKFIPRLSHWKYFECDWRLMALSLLGSERSTVFVDLPYVGAGNYYRHSLEERDYLALADVCVALHREGHQMIVCERAGAEWLPFRPLYVGRSMQTNRDGVEVVWTGEG